MWLKRYSTSFTLSITLSSLELKSSILSEQKVIDFSTELVEVTKFSIFDKIDDISALTRLRLFIDSFLTEEDLVVFFLTVILDKEHSMHFHEFLLIPKFYSFFGEPISVHSRW
jgi:hypothetical protein